MKNLFCVLLVCLLFPMPIMANENVLHRISGVWTLNGADQNFGGQMKIYNCNDMECDFKLESWYDLHICDVEGKLTLNNAISAIYTDKYPMYNKKQGGEYWATVGIVFELLQDGSLNVKYLNSDSYHAFCGMSATVEGLWLRQQG